MTIVLEAPLVEEALDRYGALVAPRLAALVPAGASPDYLVEPMVEYPNRGGKSLRPALCLATCEAFGGSADDALASAVALEALHNAFLVHDDIEDASELRRGQPTLHRRYGTALALNAGDGLTLMALAALRDNIARLGPRMAERVMAEFEFMGTQTVDGQALELGWRQDNRLDLGPADYLELIMKKTCWYTTILPLRLGALIGSWGTADLQPMIDFGFNLGAAFQIRDDILNLVPDGGRYGKEELGDLREGKRTLVLIHLLAAAEPAERRWIEDYLAGPLEARTMEEARELHRLVLRHGSIAFAGEFARGMATAAERMFERAFAGLPDGPARRFIRQLIPYMVERAA
jgi:geranylgeranyl diphosphate synthase type II